ncbi:PA0069 family radical SAM protein [Gimesia chilikensis]|uniref:Radical SAM superfamily protein n=1 Tax=Gimesia chilikensis TaxID=2605989 RepID=A0A517PYM5_9PLAN|nr:PA0069 family radical SAM protein [Gimesia chilikensis]QDT24478.1 Radical SAM superfamily protein [Gimesia chilikensis]
MRHGSHINPPNRFESKYAEPDLEQLEWDDEYLSRPRRIEYLDDQSKSIVTENDSPDLNFRFSVNPYRGCAHGCSYCYARPFHEYLGYNAGLDFETKIMVKRDAPKLFRDFLSRSEWQPELIAFSGITDCYQPAEREFQLTRQCLEVASEANQPVGIVTKNALVVRDLDILQSMAQRSLVNVSLSITTLDPELAREMEPRTSIPAARLRAIRELSAAGVPTKVMVSPIIAGLNDHEIPAILQAAKGAGASSASYIMLRLPLTVEPVFLEWLERTQPTRKERVISRIRQTRDGKLNSAEFGTRIRGTGEISEQIGNLFQVFARKHGLDERLPALDFTQFRPPTTGKGQQWLF